jgi:hypothetical protein
MDDERKRSFSPAPSEISDGGFKEHRD